MNTVFWCNEGNETVITHYVHISTCTCTCILTTPWFWYTVCVMYSIMEKNISTCTCVWRLTTVLSLFFFVFNDVSLLVSTSNRLVFLFQVKRNCSSCWDSQWVIHLKSIIMEAKPKMCCHLKVSFRYNYCSLSFNSFFYQ